MAAQPVSPSVRPGEVDLLDRESFEALARHNAWPCVSLYLPTHRAGPEVQQGPIRLRNLLRAADDQLTAAPEAPRAVLEPVEALLDDPWFWQYQADGLVVFSAPGLFCRFRVPMAVEESAVVAESFHLTPLLPLLSGDGHFCILALSQKDVRLFEASRLAVAELDTPELPAGLTDALGDVGGEDQLQLRSVAPTGRGERAAVFHGHGGGAEDKKQLLERYFRVVDRAVCARLTGERAPLVLGAVSYYLPVYRRVSSYPNVVDDAVVGNPDGWSAAELHSKAWPVVERHFAVERHAELAAYATWRGSGRVAVGVGEAVAAAFHGRVATLFVAQGASRWGCVDPLTGVAEVHEERRDGDVDLVDAAVTGTLVAGGTVYALEPDDMPESGRLLAARLRY